MASPALAAAPLSHHESLTTSYVQVVNYSDLTDTAGTTKTLSVFSGKAKQGLGNVFFAIETNFDGGSTSDLTVSAILNYTSGTDKTVVPAVSIHEDGTEVPSAPVGIDVVDTSTTDTTFGAQELAVLDDLRTKVNLITGRIPIMANGTWTLDLAFTSSSANLDALTSGKLKVVFEVYDLTRFAGTA